MEKQNEFRATSILVISGLILGMLAIMPTSVLAYPDFTISGTVYDTYNNSVPNVRVYCLNLNTNESIYVTTNYQGIYSVNLANLPSGYTSSDVMALYTTTGTYAALVRVVVVHMQARQP